MRLWTLQRRVILNGDKITQKYEASWDATPKNWRTAYRWMSDRMADRIGMVCDSAPIWCWHSCNGLRNQGPTIGTATALLSEWEIEQGIVVVHLDLPDRLALLSSYYSWNEFLNCFLESGRLQEQSMAECMFAEPLMKHDTDDIQAVIPYIDPAWVISIADVKSIGRQRDQRI